MRGFSFSGGVHPPEQKQFTEEKQIKVMPPSKMVVIPLLQHAGILCDPLVAKGDSVKKGQKIGQARGLITAPVHASISGTVIDVRPYNHPLGAKIPAVLIESDGKDEWCPEIQKDENYFRLLPEEVRDKVRDKGIVGLGGAAFPTAVKLTPPEDKNVDTIIVNGCECEPYLTCDYRLMLEKPHELIEGLKIMMKTLDVSRGIVAIEDNKPKAIALLTEEVKKEPNIEVVVVKTKYPQGAEKQLIKAILNREIPSGKLPFDVGVIVDNVGTVIAIYEALHDNKPLIERVITVTGSGVKDPQNLQVRIGTLFSDIINECGGLRGEVAKIIMGGPMMGIAQYLLDMPVVKGTSGLVALIDKESLQIKTGPCIRCAKCVEACPMGLSPYLYGLYGGHEDYESMEKYHLTDCMECGVCAYGCPAKIPLVHYAKWGKMEIAKARRQKSEPKKDAH